MELFGDVNGNSGSPGQPYSVLANQFLNDPSREELSPLTFALLEQQTTAARELIDGGIDQMNGFGSFTSALHLAVAQANPEIVEALLMRNQGNIDVRNQKFETPMHTVIQKLSNSNFPIEMIGVKNRLYGKTNSAITNPKNKLAAKMKQFDALAIPFEKRLKACGEILIYSGADLSAQEQSNWSFVHVASKSYSADTIKWMISVNKELKARQMESFDFEQKGGTKDWTPLHVACYTGSYDVIEELLDKAQVDIFSRSLNDKLPRQVARNTIIGKVLRLAERNIIYSQFGYKKQIAKND